MVVTAAANRNAGTGTGGGNARAGGSSPEIVVPRIASSDRITHQNPQAGTRGIRHDRAGGMVDRSCGMVDTPIACTP